MVGVCTNHCRVCGYTGYLGAAELVIAVPEVCTEGLLFQRTTIETNSLPHLQQMGGSGREEEGREGGMREEGEECGGREEEGREGGGIMTDCETPFTSTRTLGFFAPSFLSL